MADSVLYAHHRHPQLSTKCVSMNVGVMPDQDHLALADGGKTVVIRPSAEAKAKESTQQDQDVDLLGYERHATDRKIVSQEP